MRALVLLLLGGGLIWAVLMFFPQADEGAPSDEVVAAEVEEDDAPPVVRSEPPVELPVSPPPVSSSTESGFQVPIGQADLGELGFLLVHRDAAAVGQWLDLSDDLLAADLEAATRAFALAADGDRAGAREVAKRISSAEALPGRVRWALQRVLAGDFQSPWPANLAGGDPFEEGLLIRLGLVEAQALYAQRKDDLAAERLSRTFLGELDAPWPADLATLQQWRLLLDKIQARHRWNPKGNWPSEQVVVESGDSLTLIRKRYVTKHTDRLMCTGLIARANGLKNDLIHPDDVLRIPTAKVSMLVDLDAHWLLYLHDDEVVAAYPVGVVEEGQETILGQFTIGEKQEEPTWFRPDGPPLVYGEEGNALGTRYMAWYKDGVKTHFGFHGTWEPETIGKNKSQGCIRMFNADVEAFFLIVPRDTKFVVQP